MCHPVVQVFPQMSSQANFEFIAMSESDLIRVTSLTPPQPHTYSGRRCEAAPQLYHVHPLYKFSISRQRLHLQGCSLLLCAFCILDLLCMTGMDQNLCHAGAVAVKILFILHEGLKVLPMLPHEGDCILSESHVVSSGSLQAPRQVRASCTYLNG